MTDTLKNTVPNKDDINEHISDVTDTLKNTVPNKDDINGHISDVTKSIKDSLPNMNTLIKNYMNDLSENIKQQVSNALNIIPSLKEQNLLNTDKLISKDNKINLAEKINIFGIDISSFTAENINNLVGVVKKFVKTNIEPLDLKNVGYILDTVFKKFLCDIAKNIDVVDIFKCIKPDLMEFYTELIDVGHEVIKKSGPKFNDVMYTLLDSFTGLISTTSHRLVNLLWLLIKDIIGAIPVAGQVFDTVNIISKTVVMVAEIVSKVIHGIKCSIETYEFISCTIYDNLVSINKIKDIVFKIIFKLFSKYQSILDPLMGLGEDTDFSNPLGINSDIDDKINEISNNSINNFNKTKTITKNTKKNY